MKSYIFDVRLLQEDDSSWTAIVDALPGCAANGKTVEEAIDYVRDMAKAYVEVLIEDGRPLPSEGVSVLPGAAVEVLVA
jgi:predicted RNase H-like HicB family nuclease